MQLLIERNFWNLHAAAKKTEVLQKFDRDFIFGKIYGLISGNLRTEQNLTNCARHQAVKLEIWKSLAVVINQIIWL